MHMADALITPEVGGTMIAVTAGLIAYSSKKIKNSTDDKIVPLMGVLGAFIFAAQMINFTIPGTGSSGHIGGGMLLAVLLGPYAAFITIASVLIIQAFFFADGGLLALGCNIFNLGFFPCFIFYLLIYKKIAVPGNNRIKVIAASMLAVLFSLQAGSFSVVLQTWLSGISVLPFKTFTMIMQPIHLAIGLVEGAATASIILFLYKAEPGLVIDEINSENRKEMHFPVKIISVVIFLTIITGGLFSWFASSKPDGLEWSIFKVSGIEEMENSGNTAHAMADNLQKLTSFLPGYNFKIPANVTEQSENEEAEKWPDINKGTSVSGFIGGALTLILAMFAGIVMKRRKTA